MTKGSFNDQNIVIGFRDNLLTHNRLLALTPIGEAGVRSRSEGGRKIILKIELSKLFLMCFEFGNLDT